MNAYHQFGNEPLPLFDDPGPQPHFGGETYVPEFDQERLNAQAKRVYGVLLKCSWVTLAEISAATGDPEASASARIRDFRKAEFGSHTIDRRRRGDAKRGLWEYRLVK